MAPGPYLFLRPHTPQVLAASQDEAAAYAAGQETPLKLDRVLADLMAAAEDGSGEEEALGGGSDAYVAGTGQETGEFEAQRRFLRQQVGRHN